MISMKRVGTGRLPRTLQGALFGLSLVHSACGTTEGTDPIGSGGTRASDGGSAADASGGAPDRAGGAPAVGGTTQVGGSSSGGTRNTVGGAPSSGGAPESGGAEGNAAGGHSSAACLKTAGPKPPGSARSFGFQGTDLEYSELYDAPCQVDGDCVPPCTERGGTGEFCADSVCVHSSTDYCLPPTKWRGVDNALSEGADIDSAAVTSLSVANGTEHDRLVLDHFGFDIPSGATIEGIVITIRHAAGGAEEASDQRVRIVKAGAIGLTPREKPGFWPETLTDEDYGGTSDLWGEEWSPAEINSAQFGVAVAALPGDTGGRAYVDIAYVSVNYSDCDE